MTLRPRVITASDARRVTRGAEAPVPEDGYVSQVIKYIPAEIITLQQFLNGAGGTSEGLVDNRTLIFGGLSLGLLVLTPFWFAASTRDKGEPISWSQVVLSTVAFAIWLLALNGPAILVLHHFGVPASGLTAADWSMIFAFFVGVTPLLAKVIPR